MNKRKRRAKQADTTPKLFRGNPDYKAEFTRAVSEIVTQPIVDRAERIRPIDNLIDEYITAVGERPDHAECERLADAVLYEELTDKNPHKIAHAEYPILSESQFKLRNSREYKIDLAENIGSDGVNYVTPTRRHRTRKETRFIDKVAKIRNAERRRTYRKETQPSEVVTYNLRDGVI